MWVVTHVTGGGDAGSAIGRRGIYDGRRTGRSIWAGRGGWKGCPVGAARQRAKARCRPCALLWLHAHYCVPLGGDALAKFHCRSDGLAGDGSAHKDLRGSFSPTSVPWRLDYGPLFCLLWLAVSICLSPLIQQTMFHLSATYNRKWSTAAAGANPLPLFLLLQQGFRSAAALEALQSHIRASEGGLEKPRLVLYNYPSFAGAFAALFAHLYHSSLNLPCLILPFSSVEPLRVEDFRFGDIHSCYLLDFLGPKGFAGELAKIVPRLIAFDHRLSTQSRISKCPNNLEIFIDTKKSSARVALDYFSKKYTEEKSSCRGHKELLNLKDHFRVEKMVRYIEDVDLRRWELASIKEFEIGIKGVRAKLNTLTNPYIFKQLLELDADDLIANGNSYVASRQDAAKKLLVKPFKIRLGRGLYGECLAIRADGNAELSHEIAIELSSRSAEAGLRYED
ncbi:hypothetical protein KSP39_PZI004597 [Platanthera zijinensis]|uniref:Uncharacterized protein n=1 Tax=Platanthera zijinensis TaxID=2320716 RepID=A0AAP0BU21_9ASPA